MTAVTKVKGERNDQHDAKNDCSSSTEYQPMDYAPGNDLDAAGDRLGPTLEH
jgi:hypothetical protein